MTQTQPPAAATATPTASASHSMTQDPMTTIVRTQMRIALGCILVTLLGGVFTILHYQAPVSDPLADAGITMQRLRPIHTTFASAWIFAGCLAVIYHYLGTTRGGLTAGDRWRFWAHTGLWVASGIAFFYLMFTDQFTGREYLPFPPIVAGVVVLGWLLFAFSFLRRLKHGFWGQPIYIYFWTIGTLYFLYTFCEGHAHYFFASLADKPTHDLAVQWKSCGTLVGSFNFLVYGCLVYVSERITGDKSYGQSKTAFALFGVGCLNSFTNFAHHTYHIPQSETVKWIAFVVSMAESAIFLKLMFDLLASLRKRSRATDATVLFFASAKWWSCIMIFLGIVISVPTLNSFIHGTQVIVGHAMGTELGIDSFVLFGSLCYLLRHVGGNKPRIETSLSGPGMRRQNLWINIAFILPVGWLHIAGTATGIKLYYNEPVPKWVAHGNAYLFPLFGGILALTLLHIGVKWMLLSRSRPAVATTD